MVAIDANNTSQTEFKLAQRDAMTTTEEVQLPCSTLNNDVLMLYRIERVCGLLQHANLKHP
jgi:hypothetical protein